VTLPAAIDLRDKLARFGEHWSPKVVAELYDYQLKVVKTNTGAAGGAYTAPNDVWV